MLQGFAYRQSTQVQATGTIKWQAIARPNADQVLWCHMMFIGHHELTNQLPWAHNNIINQTIPDKKVIRLEKVQVCLYFEIVKKNLIFYKTLFIHIILEKKSRQGIHDYIT